MKRKPNRPKQEPMERPGSWESTADPGGAAGGGSPGDAGAADSGTSGQSVQKSKFRQKSQQEQAAASKLRMEKRGEKLEAAKDKLAKQKPPKKPGPVRRMGRAAGGTVHGFVHGKLFEVEPPCGMAPASSRRKSGNTRQRLSSGRSPNISRLRRIISSAWRPRSTRSWRKMPGNGFGRNGNTASRHGRPPGLGRQRRQNRLPPPRKEPEPRRWASSSGIPWGCSWPWPVCSCSL